MSEKMKELKILFIFVAVFIASYFLPVDSVRFNNGVNEAFLMLKEYAQLHVLLCLVPALFIAGAVSVFVSQDAVMKYLGAKANKFVSYAVASVSGAILAVCSCTILPLFSGIYKRGAGLGPAIAFLYSGPAINILAIVLTARVLGFRLGVARAVGAILMSIVIGLLMSLFFQKAEQKRQDESGFAITNSEGKPLGQTVIYFALMIFFLVIVNWAKPVSETAGLLTTALFTWKWVISSIIGFLLGLVIWKWYGLDLWKLVVIVAGTVVVYFVSSGNNLITYLVAVTLLSLFLATGKGEIKEWLGSTWYFTKLIVPLLFIGVVIAGALLGRPGSQAWIPSHWISGLVGGNSIWANLFASIVGAFMYFATLTEVPILQGLIGNGMGQGPALALLLAGPTLSLPSILVVNKVLGIKKTAVYISLVVIISTITGYVYGVLI